MHKKILVISTDNIESRVIFQILEKTACSVTAAVTIGEAQIRIGEDNPAVVLVDINPGGELKGIEIARAFINSNRIPFLFLTDYSNGKLIQEVAPVPHYVYLLKPFSEGQLHATIETAIQKHELYIKLRESENQYRELVGSAGSLENILCAGNDITSHRKSVSDLKESELNLRTIFNRVNEAIIICDLSGQIIDVNNQMLKMYELTREAALAMRLHDISSAEINLELRSIWQDVLSGNDRILEWKALRPSRGIPFDVEAALARISWYGADAVLATIRDITVRKRSEEKLSSRLKYEAQIAAASKSLLTDSENSIENALLHLLRASGSCRIYLSENFNDPERGLCMRVKNEVYPEGSMLQAGNTLLRETAYGDLPAEMRENLGNGLIFNGFVDYRLLSDSPAAVENAKILTLIIPIRVNGRWWGCLGFEDTLRRSMWSTEDIILLEAGSDMMSAYIERCRTSEIMTGMNRRLNDIIDFLPDATFVIDTGHRVIAWNRAMERMTGFKKEEMLGEDNYKHSIPFYGVRKPTIIDLFDSNTVNLEQDYEQSYVEDNSIFVETYLPAMQSSQEGTYVWGKATPLYDASGGLAGTIESIRDITSYKKIEAALQLSEQKYRAIFESSGTSMILADNNGIIQLVNETFVSSMGIPKNEIEGKMQVEIFIEPEYLDRYRSFVNRMKNDTAVPPGTIDLCIRDRSGGKRDIIAYITGIAKTDMHIVSIVDVTEIKRLEKEVIEISMREQQNIGRSLHDDLGQLLTGTGFLCESLIKKMARNSSPETDKIEKIHGLIQNAREHTRALARGLFPVDIYSGGLIAAISRLLKDYETIYNATFSFSYDTYADNENMVELQLYYIIREAVTNAIRHGKAEKIGIALSRENGRLHLLIRDNGTGITTDTEKSSGMGIRIMMYRARTIGAVLSITNAPEGGTVISCIK